MSDSIEQLIVVMPHNLVDELKIMVIPSSDENSKILDDFKINDVVMNSIEKFDYFVKKMNKKMSLYKLKKDVNEVQYYQFNNFTIKIDYNMLT